MGLYRYEVCKSTGAGTDCVNTVPHNRRKHATACKSPIARKEGGGVVKWVEKKGKEKKGRAKKVVRSRGNDWPQNYVD
jgi:hypothetical protein